MYYFYIVRCSDNSLYCGQTSNLKRRIIEHNSNTMRSAKYLRGKTPVKLVYFERFRSLKKAMKREWQIKQWSKVKKEALIRGDTALLKKTIVSRLRSKLQSRAKSKDYSPERSRGKN